MPIPRAMGGEGDLDSRIFIGDGWKPLKKRISEVRGIKKSQREREILAVP